MQFVPIRDNILANLMGMKKSISQNSHFPGQVLKPGCSKHEEEVLSTVHPKNTVNITSSFKHASLLEIMTEAVGFRTTDSSVHSALLLNDR